MNIKEHLYNLIDEALKEAVSSGDLPEAEYPAIKIEYPKDAKFGDYSTPIALESAKLIKRSPLEIGEILKKYLLKNDDLISEIEIAKPGFINIFISLNYLKKMTLHIINIGDEYGKRKKNDPLKYNIEFVSANPTGPLNVVSARAAAIGDTISNLMEANGDFVDREFYVNDFGNQVNLLGQSVLSRIREIKGEETVFPDDGYHGEYIRDIAAWIIENHKGELDSLSVEDDKINFCSKKAVEYNVSGQQRDLSSFNVNFRTWFRESTLHEKGEVDRAFEKLEKGKFIYTDNDNKKIFRSTDFGDDKDRVVIRDDGRPTYLMADISYHYDKIMRGYDRIIDIWGPDHHGYIARLSGAVQALGFDKEKFRVLISQQVNLIMDGESVKMSKRLGNFSTMRELIDEIGVDVSRYFFIMRSLDSHLDFDLSLAKKNSSENPVFYLQYAHARICSIFREAEKRDIKYNLSDFNIEFLSNKEGVTLMKQMAKFPEEVIDAAESFEPHKIATYLMRLAQSYHRYYTEHRILSDNFENTNAALALCRAIVIVMKNGLKILGVSAPEVM
ncbi:MAG TPA: arginine--tRNA ligase [Spirochaetota bacterium]|nr:arginine--tRNA ligase [Spirochaetota bacterium]HPF04440.1 arginine--tRNA ligase [Spirochaetota bacterium]HPR36057.1 arginine--tRNA ligase [Spirochaetota bacterium]